MLVKLIHLVLSKTRVTVVNVTEPPLRGVGSCGDGHFLNLFHYEVSYNGTDWRTQRTSKDLFVMGIVVFEVVVIENKFHDVADGLFLEAWFSIRDPKQESGHAKFSSARARRAVFESRVLTLFFQLMKA